MLVSVCFLWFRPVGFNLVEYMGELLSAEETERRYPKIHLALIALNSPTHFFWTLLFLVALAHWLITLAKVRSPMSSSWCALGRDLLVWKLSIVKAGDEILYLMVNSLWTFRIGNGTIQILLPPLFHALPPLVELNLWLCLLVTLLLLSASAVLLPMWSPHFNLFLLPRLAALLLLMRLAPGLVLFLLLLRPMCCSRPRIVLPVL